MDRATDAKINGPASLKGLPEDALNEILSGLSAQELNNLCLANPGMESFVSRVAEAAMKKDGLPGTSVQELKDHFSRLEEYKLELLESLRALALGASAENAEPNVANEALCKFLLQAIQNFTIRVAGAHSWYKHLPIGLGHQFEFCFDLTVNMKCQRKDGQWEKKVRGDGTEFHYTWLPTDEYRSFYGFFDYRRTLPNQEGVMRVHNENNECFCIPLSACGPPVDVTAAIHSYSIPHSFYRRVFKEAVDTGNPSLVHDKLKENAFHGLQSRCHNSEDMYLPTEAADDLEVAVRQALANEGSDSREERLETQDSDSDGSSSGSGKDPARRALFLQQCRERQTVALSLRELCLRNLGPECTPSKEDVLALHLAGRRGRSRQTRAAPATNEQE